MPIPSFPSGREFVRDERSGLGPWSSHPVSRKGAHGTLLWVSAAALVMLQAGLNYLFWRAESVAAFLAQPSAPAVCCLMAVIVGYCLTAVLTNQWAWLQAQSRAAPTRVEREECPSVWLLVTAAAGLALVFLPANVVELPFWMRFAISLLELLPLFALLRAISFMRAANQKWAAFQLRDFRIAPAGLDLRPDALAIAYASEIRNMPLFHYVDRVGSVRGCSASARAGNSHRAGHTVPGILFFLINPAFRGNSGGRRRRRGR